MSQKIATVTTTIATLIGALGSPSPTLAEPYDQCGVYVQGLEGCILFQPDNGGANVRPDQPPLTVGTRARVRGDQQPCVSFCFTPCIFNALITTCSAPCRVDFDGSGSLSPSDIFAFLSAWFAGSASADFDMSGSLSVQDIFAFINAWFAGC